MIQPQVIVFLKLKLVLQLLQPARPQIVLDEAFLLEHDNCFEGGGPEGLQFGGEGLADDEVLRAGGALWELDDAPEADIGGLNEVEVGLVGVFEAGEVGLEQFQRVVGVEQRSSLGGHLLVAGTVLDLVHAVDLLLGDLVDGHLEDSVDGVVVDLLVLLHLHAPLLVVGEDYVPRVLLPRPPLDLDVGLQREGRVEGNHQVAAGNVEAFLGHAGCDQHAVLLALELEDLLYLVGVLLLNLKQHFPHLGEVHPRHLLVQGLVVSVAHQDALLEVHLVVAELHLGLHEVLVVAPDAGLVLISRRVGLIGMPVLRPVYLLPARVASHSDALIKVLLLLVQLGAVALQHHLQKLDRPALEGKHQHHVRHALLLELFSTWLEDVYELNDLLAHVPLFALAELVLQGAVVPPQQVQDVLQQLRVLRVSQPL